MKKKIPPDAYAIYLSQGTGRSYAAVAKVLGVTKRAVAFRAERENWQKKLQADEAITRQKAEKAAAENIQTMREQDLKVIRFSKGRCVEALKTLPIDSAIDAIKSFALLVKVERELRGEPTDRTENFAEVCKSEFSRWLVKDEPVEAPADLNAPGEPQPQFPVTPMSIETSDAPAQPAAEPEAGPKAVDDPDDSED